MKMKSVLVVVVVVVLLLLVLTPCVMLSARAQDSSSIDVVEESSSAAAVIAPSSSVPVVALSSSTPRPSSSLAQVIQSSSVAQPAQSSSVAQVIQSSSVAQPAQSSSAPRPSSSVAQPSLSSSVAQPLQSSSVAQVAQSSSVAQPLQSSSVAQPAQSSSVAQVAQSSSVAQPLQSSSVAQIAQSSSVAQPAQSSSVAQLAQSSSAAQVAQSSSVAQIAQSSSVAQPAQSSSVAQVAQSSSAPRPSSSVAQAIQSSSVAQPAQSSSVAQLIQSSSVPAVAPSSSVAQPAQSSSVAQPMQSSSVAQAAQSSSAAQAAQSSSVAQVAQSSSVAQPTQSSSAPQPAQSSSVAQPAQSSSVAQPAQSSSVAQPAQSSAAQVAQSSSAPRPSSSISQPAQSSSIPRPSSSVAQPAQSSSVAQPAQSSSAQPVFTPSSSATGGPVFNASSSYNVTQTSGAGVPLTFPNGGTSITRTDDVMTVGVPIGFSFVFFNTSYTQVNLNDNGLVQFVTTAQQWAAQPLPSAAAFATPFIAGFWSDLRVDLTSTGSVAYETVGYAPSRVFVVRNNLPYYYDASLVVVFDIELYESTNVIKVHYYSMTARQGTTATIAVANAGATDYTVFCPFNGVTLTTQLGAQINGTTVTFAPTSNSTSAVTCNVPSFALSSSAPYVQSSVPNAQSSSVPYVQSSSAPYVQSSVAQAAQSSSVFRPSSSVTQALQSSSASFVSSTSAPLPSSAPVLSSSAPLVPVTLSTATSNVSTYAVVITPASSDPSRRLVLNASTAVVSGDDQVLVVPIGFSFGAYGVPYTNLALSTNGNIQFGSSGTTNYIPFAFTTDGTSTSSLSVPFVAMLWSDLYASLNPIRYQVLGNAPNRVVVVRYESFSWYVDVNGGLTLPSLSFDVLLYETTNVIEVRYFSVSARVTASTYAAQVGIYGSASNWASVWNSEQFTPATAAAFTNVTLAYIPQVLSSSSSSAPYVPPSSSSSSSGAPQPTPVVDAPRALSPRHGATSSYDAAHVRAVSRELLDRPLSLTPLAGAPVDDGLYSWTLPFAFRVGSVTTSIVTISTNGNLQFGGGMHSYRFVPEPLPKGDGELLPLLSYLFTDINVTSAAQFQVGVLGNSTNERVAILRVQAVGTASNRSAASSIDVLLFEGVNRIEVRYYNVGVFTERTLIALQNADARDFAVFWNAEALTNDARALLSGSTIVFQPRVAFAANGSARRLRRRLLFAMA